MAENPAKDIPINLIGSMIITTLCYCLLVVTLCLMQPFRIIGANTPLLMVFSAVGMDWTKYIVAVDALKGMTTVLLVSATRQAHYLSHIA